MSRIIFFLLLIILTYPVQATVLDISPDGLGQYPDMLHAMMAFSSGDSIRLADGVYTGAENRDIVLGGVDLNIYSASGNPANCILDLEGLGRGFFIYSTPTTQIRIAGLTLRAGSPGDIPDEYWSDTGGALMCEGLATGGEIQIDNCILEDNFAEAGGAAFIWNCEVIFQDCIVRNNLATDGAGIYCGFCEMGNGVQVLNSVFYNNDYPYAYVGVS